jgi:hypothetical protein
MDFQKHTGFGDDLSPKFHLAGLAVALASSPPTAS